MDKQWQIGSEIHFLKYSFQLNLYNNYLYEQNNLIERCSHEIYKIF